jgi:hypothetical protein
MTVRSVRSVRAVRAFAALGHGTIGGMGVAAR